MTENHEGETVEPGAITVLLQRVEAGDSSAHDELFSLVYRDLRRQAGGHMRGQRGDHTLQATALVHEAYLKMFGKGAGRWESRRHFLAVASRAMRHILVDHARSKKAKKHGGDIEVVRAELDDLGAPAPLSVDVIDLDRALERLREEDERAADVVDLRYFAQLSMAEIASVLGTPKRSIERDWTYARLWLHRALAPASEPAQSNRSGGDE